ncbi:polymorphic repeat outer membrane protein [Histomonas meleagridis]|uniref:polymorphic repeat outer membrane protein n=1 Tax=Histomonas meleagridis TaxID=135588 RepID=UPI003559AC40|nr:polymorphic repeat outer membrane protein [Histomonas meleagridis]KAH0801702.1 polymorphic repeat outer membrane protein [Histomonas meleagridis]
MRTATLIVRTADTLIFPSGTIHPTSYPSDFSDLFIQLSLMNTTVNGKGTIVDGTYLAGEMLWQITSQPTYTWCLFNDWVFTKFSKPIATRQFAWSTAPYIIFRDCTFLDSTTDLFIMKGGTLIFENCVFKNITGRAVKSISEFRSDFVDCIFENCNSLFFQSSSGTFTNCKFIGMHGQRGGAIYAIRSTISIINCHFINCIADVSGGALYIRDSPEKYESEVIDSCFINTKAEVNGSAIYVYESNLALSRNCFESESSVYAFGSNVSNEETKYDAKCNECLKKEPKKYIEIDYTPTDTNKWFQFDDLKSGTTIVVGDDEL